MKDWQERLMAQLDRDRPDWFIEWASQEDFQGAAFFSRVPQDQFLRDRVSRRLFHAILHAALGAGIVTEVLDDINEL